MPPRPPTLTLNPYRLFHLSARLRLRARSSSSSSSSSFSSFFSSSSSSAPATDDYYTLLLTTPAAENTIKPTTNLAPKSPQPSTPAETKILFSQPLSGPSPRMRGLARAERGLERPPEPDNCCMSGCVNCVWDAYREEVEEWAAVRRRRRGDDGVYAGGMGGDDGGVGELDGVGGGFEGVELSEEGMFEGVPVGIREFMSTEKRLRERREGRGGMG